MQNGDYYMSLPYDVSGSLSKNRFRLELLWGINRMLDIYDSTDFIMVFDYVCDIEVHTGSGFEFYQIKTHKGDKTYSEKDITKLKNGHSILGKLYVLKRTEDCPNVKLAIVTNAYFKDGKIVRSDVEEISLSSISQASIDKMCLALREELNLTTIDFSNIYYIYTSMNLNEPQNDVIGKIVTSFAKVKGCEPKKPFALYRLIYDTVSGKACCELTQSDYAQLISNKGMTKSEFDALLNSHLDTADNSVKLTKEYIDGIQDFKERRRIKAAFAKMFPDIQTSKELQTIEKEIGKYIVKTLDELPDDFKCCIDTLISKFGASFPVEYSKHEIHVFIILILKRFEEGVYDE